MNQYIQQEQTACNQPQPLVVCQNDNEAYQSMCSSSCMQGHWLPASGLQTQHLQAVSFLETSLQRDSAPNRTFTIPNFQNARIQRVPNKI